MAEGLRERKKRATVNAIEQAGVRFALEKGHRNVTVQEICDAADISRSTFFNYMPTREAAIFGRPLRMMPREDALAVLDSPQTPGPLAAIMFITLVSAGGNEINQEVAAGRHRLSIEQPDCMPAMLAPRAFLDLEMQTLLTEWYELHPERQRLQGVSAAREAGHVITITSGALRALMASMTGGDDNEMDMGQIAELVKEIETTAAGLVEDVAVLL